MKSIRCTLLMAVIALVLNSSLLNAQNNQPGESVKLPCGGYDLSISADDSLYSYGWQYDAQVNTQNPSSYNRCVSFLREGREIWRIDLKTKFPKDGFSYGVPDSANNPLNKLALTQDGKILFATYGSVTSDRLNRDLTGLTVFAIDTQSGNLLWENELYSVGLDPVIDIGIATSPNGDLALVARRGQYFEGRPYSEISILNNSGGIVFRKTLSNFNAPRTGMAMTHIFNAPVFDAENDQFIFLGSQTKIGYDCQGTNPGRPYGLGVSSQGVINWELIDNHFALECYVPESASIYAGALKSDGSGYGWIFETDDRRYGTISFSRSGQFQYKIDNISSFPARPRLLNSEHVMDLTGNRLFFYTFGDSIIIGRFSIDLKEEDIFQVNPPNAFKGSFIGSSIEHVVIKGNQAWVTGSVGNKIPGCTSNCAFGLTIDLSTMDIVGDIKSWSETIGDRRYADFSDGRVIKFSLSSSRHLDTITYRPTAVIIK